MFSIKMITIALSVFFISLSFTSFTDASERDHVHHELEITLLPEEQKLQGRARITLPGARQEMHFFLAPTVRVDGVSLEGRDLEYTFSRGILEVYLPMATENKEVSLDISYQGRFDDKAPDRPIHNEDPTHGVSAAITGEGAFLSGRSGWYPDPRQGLATWNLSITAPPGYLAVTAGSLVQQTTNSEYSRSVWKVKHPLPNLAVSAGPYQVWSDLDGDIPIYAYFYSQSQDLAGDYLKAARRHLEFYEDLLGPYPFEKFAVVENFFPTGYGFPSWTLLGSTVIRLPFIKETSLPHEIAHSWWGNGVRVDYRQGNWSEAITTYVADYLLLERSSDEEARDYRQRILRNYSSLVTGNKDFPLSRFMSRDSRESQAIGYGKGAMVFHMLRREVGEQVFWNGLRRITREEMSREISWDDFAKHFSGLVHKDLKPFFEQWVQKPGAPLLDLHDVRLIGQEDDWTVRGKVRQVEPFFQLNLPLYLETEGLPVKSRLEMDGKEKSFELKSRSRPLRLSVDPDTHVFRRLSPREIPATVESVRGSESLIAVIADDLSAQEAQAALMLLKALSREDVRVINEKDATADKLLEKDVLFLGLPRNFTGPLLDLKDKKEFEGRDLIPDRDGLNGPDTAFVAVNLKDEPETIRAYFIISSHEAARNAAYRIPHYGRYSYLLFDEGDILTRGTWVPGDSPLEHVFSQAR
jgi:aminopeptidase N